MPHLPSFRRVPGATTRDLLYILGILAVSFWVFGFFDALESLVAFTRTYEEWELDEVVPTSMVLVVCLLIFSARRWQESLTANRELTEAIGRLKRLEGILQMCMSCKEIQDASGAWHQLEKYTSDHSDAKFSQKMCERCARRRYPEAYQDASNEGLQPVE